MSVLRLQFPCKLPGLQFSDLSLETWAVSGAWQWLRIHFRTWFLIPPNLLLGLAAGSAGLQPSPMASS